MEPIKSFLCGVAQRAINIFKPPKSQENKKNYLSAISFELFNLIFNKLDIRSACRTMQTSKIIHKLTLTTDTVRKISNLKIICETDLLLISLAANSSCPNALYREIKNYIVYHSNSNLFHLFIEQTYLENFRTQNSSPTIRTQNFALLSTYDAYTNGRLATHLLKSHDNRFFSIIEIFKKLKEPHFKMIQNSGLCHPNERKIKKNISDSAINFVEKRADALVNLSNILKSIDLAKKATLIKSIVSLDKTD